MKFNWEEFISSDNIAVHCATEEQAIDFCKQMHEHGLKWSNGENYLKTTNWESYEKETCYNGYGTYGSLDYYKNNNYTILEWSNYKKENSMNLELTNLTDEQKQQIIELAKKFEQENEVDKLDYLNDHEVASMSRSVDVARIYSKEFMRDFFDLGLTAHTKEEAEKIRRRLLVEKELRDWAKKCKEPVDWENGNAKYYIQYDEVSGKITIDNFYNYAVTNIMFTDENIIKQAIESIGQERLIRDYFGIDN